MVPYLLTCGFGYYRELDPETELLGDGDDYLEAMEFIDIAAGLDKLLLAAVVLFALFAPNWLFVWDLEAEEILRL